jgi:hypothetical protein
MPPNDGQFGQPEPAPPSDPVKHDVGGPIRSASRVAMLSVIRGATFGAALGAIVVAAILGRSLLFKSPPTAPAPTTRSSQASVAAAAPPASAKKATVALPQSVVAPPQGVVNEAPPLATATPTAVSHPNPARGALLKLHAHAVQRAQAAASLYASAEPVLRRPQARMPAYEARAALAGVRAQTARIADYAAAADRTAPDRSGALLRDAESADRNAAFQNQRLHAAVAKARALAEAPTEHPTSHPPPAEAVASAPFEAAPPAPKHAPPPAPISADDRERYVLAVHGYRHADACYRELLDDVSRTYRDRPADAERNREISRRVRAFYERLRRLASVLDEAAGAHGIGPSAMQQFDLQNRNFVADCRALRNALE